MATVYSAILEDGSGSDYWDGTTCWGYHPTTGAALTSEADRITHYGESPLVFATPSAWEAARDGDSSVGDDERGVIQGPWASADTATFYVNGFDATTTITLTAVGIARTDGVYDNTKYRLEGPVATYMLSAFDDDAWFDGFQVYATDGDECIRFADYTLDVSNMLLIGSNGSTIVAESNSASNHYMWNCVIYSDDGDSDTVVEFDDGTWYFYNNTCWGGTSYGLDISGLATVDAINNVVFGNGDDFNGTFNSLTNNASDDGDGTNPETLDSSSDYGNEFTDLPGRDFTLVSGSAFLGEGTDDPGSGLYSDDITGFARTSTWDIGAFEYDDSGPGGNAPTGVFYGVLVGPLGGPI